VTRVPPSRVPSNRPPAAPSRILKAAVKVPVKAPVRAPLIKAPKKPHQLEKEVKVKTGQGGEEGEAPTGGEGMAKPGEPLDAHEHARMAELWAPESHAEKAEEKKEKDEIHKANELAEEGTDPKSKGFLKQIKPALAAPFQQKKPVKDGFEQRHDQPVAGQPKQGEAAKAQTAQAAQAAQKTLMKAPVVAAAAVQAPVTTPPPPVARPSRPPDAFSVLHAAQEPGIYFKEDGHHGAAEQANPELEEAIEEAIRLLFGVRGILRVSGGFNQANEPAIVVVTTQGFGEASLKMVPAKVHKFETILAVPYDMLPLKRDRT
jgi:hypothetical protein